MNQHEAQRKYIREPGIPFWVKIFAVFSCMLAITVSLRYSWRKMSADTARAQALQDKEAREAEQKARRKKAEELAAEGFEKLRMARRNQLYLLCVEHGDFPMFFIDKVVCVKQEAIAWSKRDENPEVDTTE